jgi:osmotically-inducible protein OsmY
MGMSDASAVLDRSERSTGGYLKQASRASKSLNRVDAAMVDSVLESRVLTALANNPHLPRRRFECETQQGKVVLRGIVGSYYQKQMAQETLRSIEGIHQIENLLQVHWT